MPELRFSVLRFFFKIFFWENREFNFKYLEFKLGFISVQDYSNWLEIRAHEEYLEEVAESKELNN